MIKITLFASVVALSTVAAASAGAAQLGVSSPAAPIVRIAVAGKSPDQLNLEIKAAAETVCAADEASVTCLQDVVDDADSQLSDIDAAHRTSVSDDLAAEHDDSAAVLVSLKGKSPAQIDAAIRAAADAVCKEGAGSDYAACFDAAVADAKYKLRPVAQFSAPHAQAAS